MVISDKLRQRVIVLVATVWTVNFAAGLAPWIDYVSDPMINGIFMGIVGTVFVAGARNKTGNGNGGTGGTDG